MKIRTSLLSLLAFQFVHASAVDLTLFDLKTGRPVDMPSTYDESTPRAYAFYPGGTGLQHWHRDLLRRAMEAERGLVILSDTGDSVYGGAPGDNTCLLRELLAQNISCLALVPLVDAAMRLYSPDHSGNGSSGNGNGENGNGHLFASSTPVSRLCAGTETLGRHLRRQSRRPGKGL
jgi:hypothetical protein